MKMIRYLIVVFTVVLFMTSCGPTPNHLHEPVNSTESGSGAVSNNDASNRFDTASPAQPNGMDTTGEQTGRMNNTGK